MEDKVTRSTYIARVVARFTNPTILSVVILLLIASTKSNNVRELAGWVAIVLLFFVVIPVVYVYVKISRSGNRIKSVFELTTYLKRYPRDILVLALVLGLSCLAILSFLEAPTILISTIVALLAGAIVTALFNLFYRVSFHLAGITILIVMGAQAWGPVFLSLLAVIPLIFWAKYHIHDHTIPQLVMGIAVGVIVSLASLWLVGRMGYL